MNKRNQKGNFVILSAKKIISLFSFFSKRVSLSVNLMSKKERLLSGSFLLIALLLLGFKVNNFYLSKTKVVPAFGGTYTEGVVGELKYLNPILASNDIDTSISRLIFSPLIDIDKDGNAAPAIAQNWEISSDGLSYSVNLKENVIFHDGKKLTSADVVYTVEQIKDPNFQSPLYETWKDVQVDADGDNKVIFTLPKAYGPFIYCLQLGILPSHISPDEMSKKFVGTGPYKYASTKKTNGRISVLYLRSNEAFFDGRPYINKIDIKFFDQKNEALSSFKKEDVLGIGGIEGSGLDHDYTFETSKRLALIPNLRLEKFSDQKFRAQLLSDEPFEERTKVALTTLDSPLQRQKAEELKKEFGSRNIDLELRFMNPNQMKEVLDEKKYELLLYGFDFGYDPDLYVFWHSSQIDKLNFSGFLDKKTDPLLEEIRMTTDDAARKAKYETIFKTIADQSLAKFYDPIKFNFYVNGKVKGIDALAGIKASSRFSKISSWYIKETRVKK